MNLHHHKIRIMCLNFKKLVNQLLTFSLVCSTFCKYPRRALLKACFESSKSLHCMRVRLRNGYTQAYAQIMQHTHTHKAVTRCVEAKKLLSRRRQSNYRLDG